MAIHRLNLRLLAVLSLVCWPVPLASAQREAGAQPPPAPTGRPLSTPDLLQATEQAIRVAKQLNQQGRYADAGRVLIEAQRALESVLAADPRNIEARVLLGELAMEGRDTDGARKAFRSVLDDDPVNFRANFGLGEFYVTAHYWRQATSYLETARNVAPPNRRAEVLRLLATAYSGASRRTDAVSAAEQAVAADPNNVESFQLLVQMYLEAGQFDKAVERARKLSAAAKKKREADLSDRNALQTLLTAYQTQAQALAGYYRGLCRKDARGQYTDQLQPGKEAEAVDVLSEIAYLSAETAKLATELSYHQTLALLEPIPELQTESVRRAFENSTRYLLDLASLLRATYQEQRAIETLQKLLEIKNPTDSDPAAARKNRQTAEELLRQMNAPLTSQPAEPPPLP